MAKLNYVELPVQSTETTKAFFAAAFGWSFADFGPTYAATTTGETDLGLQATAREWTARAAAGDPGRRSRRDAGGGDGGRGHDHPADLRVSRRPAVPFPRSQRQRTGGDAA